MQKVQRKTNEINGKSVIFPPHSLCSICPKIVAVSDRETEMAAAAEVAVAVAVISHAAIVAAVEVSVVVDTVEAAVVAAVALLEVVSVDLHLVLTIKCLTMVEIFTKIINELKKELKDSSKTNDANLSPGFFFVCTPPRNSSVFNLSFEIF